MPSSCVDIDRDEMEYVDGGITTVFRYYNIRGLFHIILGVGSGASARLYLLIGMELIL